MSAEFIKAAQTLSTCLEQAAGCIDRGGDYVEALGAVCFSLQLSACRAVSAACTAPTCGLIGRQAVVECFQTAP